MILICYKCDKKLVADTKNEFHVEEINYRCPQHNDYVISYNYSNEIIYYYFTRLSPYGHSLQGYTSIGNSTIVRLRGEVVVDCDYIPLSINESGKINPEFILNKLLKLISFS